MQAKEVQQGAAQVGMGRQAGAAGTKCAGGVTRGSAQQQDIRLSEVYSSCAPVPSRRRREQQRAFGVRGSKGKRQAACAATCKARPRCACPAVARKKVMKGERAGPAGDMVQQERTQAATRKQSGAGTGRA